MRREHGKDSIEVGDASLVIGNTFVDQGRLHNPYVFPRVSVQAVAMESLQVSIYVFLVVAPVHSISSCNTFSTF
jgi:hypothetical protein